MTVRALRGLLTQKCTILQAGSGTGDYGYPALSWSSGTTSTANVSCRIVELPMQSQAELATLAVQASHLLYVAHADAPSSLRAEGAERTHRVTTITKGGATFDNGPFEVVHVNNAASADHHLELYLKRVS